jgi:hypothetical protein
VKDEKRAFVGAAQTVMAELAQDEGLALNAGVVPGTQPNRAGKIPAVLTIRPLAGVGREPEPQMSYSPSMVEV